MFPVFMVVRICDEVVNLMEVRERNSQGTRDTILKMYFS